MLSFFNLVTKTYYYKNFSTVAPADNNLAADDADSDALDKVLPNIDDEDYDELDEEEIDNNG